MALTYLHTQTRTFAAWFDQERDRTLLPGMSSRLDVTGTDTRAAYDLPAIQLHLTC